VRLVAAQPAEETKDIMSQTGTLTTEDQDALWEMHQQATDRLTQQMLMEVFFALGMSHETCCRSRGKRWAWEAETLASPQRPSRVSSRLRQQKGTSDMSEIADEAVPLQGGRITDGVVRIGDTVRRPASTASPFVASVLDLLESRGFTGAPRYLGRDEAGRDTFSFVPGWVPPKFRPWTDAQVAAAGAMARAMHDATRGSDLAGLVS
jgi:hypothetical protein